MNFLSNNSFKSNAILLTLNNILPSRKKIKKSDYEIHI